MCVWWWLGSPTCSEIVIGSKLKSSLLLGSLTEEESQFVCGKIENWFIILCYNKKNNDISYLIYCLAGWGRVLVCLVQDWHWDDYHLRRHDKFYHYHQCPPVIFSAIALPSTGPLLGSAGRGANSYLRFRKVDDAKISTFLQEVLGQAQISSYQGL